MEYTFEERRKLNLDHQKLSRRWKGERADACGTKVTLNVTPSPSSRSNKLKIRTYHRPWAQRLATAKNVSQPCPCSSGKSASSEPRSPWNKGSVSCLPAISSATQNMTAELAVTSKVPHRGEASSASNCNKEHPAQYHNKHRSVHAKGGILKTSKQTQSRDILESKNKMKHLRNKANISSRKEPFRATTFEGHSLPQPLLHTRRQSHTPRPRLLTLHQQFPSPEAESALQLISDPSEGFSEGGSLTEAGEDISSEASSKEDCSDDTSDDTLDPECPTHADILENVLEDTVLLGHRFPRIVLSSESEEEEVADDLSASWQDTDRRNNYIPVQWTGSQSCSASTSPSCSPRSLQSFSSQFTSGISGTASVCSDGHTLVPSGQPHLVPLPPITDGANRGSVASTQRTKHHLLQVVRRPRIQCRTSLTSLDSTPGTSFSESPSTAEVLEETSNTDTLLSSDLASGRGGSGQVDYTTLEMMMIHNIHEKLMRVQELQEDQRWTLAGQDAQSAKDSNLETIHRLKQRLLEESSDEEEGDQCRICRSGVTSPSNPLLTPCQCSGSLQFIHHDCLKKWIQTKIASGSELSAVKTCELCKGSLTLDLQNFDLDDYYQRQGQQVDDINAETGLQVALSRVLQVVLLR